MTCIRTIFPANAWKTESRAIITGLVAPLDEEKWSDRCSPEPTTKHPDHRIPIEMFVAGISLRKNVMIPSSCWLSPALSNRPDVTEAALKRKVAGNSGKKSVDRHTSCSRQARKRPDRPLGALFSLLCPCPGK